MATTRSRKQRLANTRKKQWRKERDRLRAEGKRPEHPFPATARKRRKSTRSSTSDVPDYQAQVQARELPRPKASQDHRPPFRQAPVPEGSWGVQPHLLDVRSSAPPPTRTAQPRVLQTVNPVNQNLSTPRAGRSLEEVIKAALYDAPNKQLTKGSLRLAAERASDYSASGYQQKLSQLRDGGQINIDNLGRRGRPGDDAVITLLAA